MRDVFDFPYIHCLLMTIAPLSAFLLYHIERARTHAHTRADTHAREHCLCFFIHAWLHEHSHICFPYSLPVVITRSILSLEEWEKITAMIIYSNTKDRLRHGADFLSPRRSQIIKRDSVNWILSSMEWRSVLRMEQWDTCLRTDWSLTFNQANRLLRVSFSEDEIIPWSFWYQ